MNQIEKALAAAVKSAVPPIPPQPGPIAEFRKRMSRYLARRKSSREAHAAEVASVLTNTLIDWERARRVSNAFCPTGEGGGIDPTCSPKNSGDFPDYAEPHFGKLSSGGRFISVRDKKTGKKIAEMELFYDDDAAVPAWKVSTVSVEKDYRRQGIATAMYDLAEKELGSKITPSKQQTDDAAAFWKNRMTKNAFCPTGEGGGIDPTCSPGGGGGGSSRLAQELEAKPEKALKILDEGRLNIDRLTPADKEELADAVAQLSAKKVARWEKRFRDDWTDYLELHGYDKSLTPEDEDKFKLPDFARLTKIRQEIIDMSRRPRTNAFCPTGEGGGVDPSCSPSESDQANSVVQDKHAKKWSIRVGDPSRRVEDMTPEQYAKLPTVYRGGRPRDKGHVYVTNDRTLAAMHGPVTVYKLKPGALVYPDPEVDEELRAFGKSRDGHTALFGLAQGSAVVHVDDLLPEKPLKKGPTGNVFCPTGEGGGVDPTCPSTKGEGGGDLRRVNDLTTNAPPSIAAGAEELYEISDEYTRAEAREIARAVKQGYTNDKSADAVARELMKRVGIDRAQADVVATTELTRFAAADKLDSVRRKEARDGTTREVMFICGEDSCPACQELHGEVFSLTEAAGVIPVHPNCTCRWQDVEDARGGGDEDDEE